MAESLEIQSIDLNEVFFQDKYVIRFWHGGTCRTGEVSFLVQNGIVELYDEQKPIDGLDKETTTKTKISFGNKSAMLVRKDRPRDTCFLCYRIYGPAKTRDDKDGEFSGLICIGTGVVNKSYAREFPRSQRIDLVAVSYDITLEERYDTPLQTAVIHAEIDAVTGYTKDLPDPLIRSDSIKEYKEKLENLPIHCLKENNMRILKTVVAVHHGFVMRDHWYLYNGFIHYLQPNVLEMVIDFALRFHDMDPRKFQEDIESFGEQSNVEIINRYMTVIVLGICYFVTRNAYVTDAWLDKNQQLKPFENFSYDVLWRKGGDCEDLAWVIQAIFEQIKYREDNTGKWPLLFQTQRLMDLYVPCSALVQAAAPQMKATSATLQISKTLNEIIINTTVEGIAEEQNRYNSYHMTCILVVADRIFPIEGRETKITLTEDQIDDLKHLVAEGTSCTYPDTSKHLSLATIDELDKLQKVVNNDENLLVTLSGKNFDGASIMFGVVLELATDYYIRHGVKRASLFLCDYKVRHDSLLESVYGTPELLLDSRDFEIVPAPECPSLQPRNSIRQKLSLEAPTPVLQLNQITRGQLNQFVNLKKLGRLNFEQLNWKVIKDSKYRQPNDVDYYPWNNIVGRKSEDMIYFRWVN